VPSAAVYAHFPLNPEESFQTFQDMIMKDLFKKKKREGVIMLVVGVIEFVIGNTESCKRTFLQTQIF
jgi:hypothetical protein